MFKVNSLLSFSFILTLRNHVCKTHHGISWNGATKQPKQHPNHIDSELLHLQLAINICPSLASGAAAGLLQQSQYSSSYALSEFTKDQNWSRFHSVANSGSNMARSGTFSTSETMATQKGESEFPLSPSLDSCQNLESGTVASPPSPPDQSLVLPSNNTEFKTKSKHLWFWIPHCTL